jgi:hypothetical protein
MVAVISIFEAVVRMPHLHHCISLFCAFRFIYITALVVSAVGWSGTSYSSLGNLYQ